MIVQMNNCVKNKNHTGLRTREIEDNEPGVVKGYQNYMLVCSVCHTDIKQASPPIRWIIKNRLNASVLGRTK